MKITEITPQIAALYWGQVCEITAVPDWYKRTLSPTHRPGQVKKIDFGIIHGLFERSGLNITPHLRRLESITEEEARELYEACFCKPFPSVYPTNAIGWFGNRFLDRKEFPANVWLKLLEWGFDLLGLIDSGLAKEIKS